MNILLLAAAVFMGNLAGGYAGELSGDGGPDVGNEKHIVFLISEDENNYEAHRTIPEYAGQLEEHHGYKTTVILGEGERSAFHFPGLEVLSEADLLVVFTRRVALKPDQMNRIKKYVSEGKPLLGIRTANHAFTVREDVDTGYTDWPEFVPEVLGCENRGYGPVDPGTEVSIVPEAKDHPILNDIQKDQWHSEGNVYHVAPLLDEQAKVLLRGQAGEQTEPVAWIRSTDFRGSVFYTSLGYPDDFDNKHFLQLLTNAVQFLIK
ncbi:MAG TPA: ThuA domain-containing protein [Fodinibius sp.]|nr:ThuA domain-containing protein [Fodinibius sp.]